MHNVVVGFDFSTGSAKAVDLAIDIANRWHNDIRLVYVKEKDEDEAPIREEIERRNAGVAHMLKGIKLEYVLRDGKVANELAKQAEEDNASIVIVGTHGMSGFEKNWIGRNTYKTITQSPAPVLSVREDFNFSKDLERILVPMDNTSFTRQKVPMAAKFAQTFGSEVHLLGLFTSNNSGIRAYVENYMAQAAKYMEKLGVKYVTKFVEAEKNITVQTLEYAKEINADMIAIMTEQEKAFSDWFIGSSAQQMLHMSTMPILSVRPEHVSESR